LIPYFWMPVFPEKILDISIIKYIFQLKAR